MINKIDTDTKKLLELDFYFREYFEIMLYLLEKLNAVQKLKSIKYDI